MIIDTHMHIGTPELLAEDIVQFLKGKGLWEEMDQKMKPEGVIQALDEGKIDMGVIFPLTFMPPDGQWQKLNDMTASYVESYPERLIGYSIIDPRDIPGSIKELERAFTELNFRGVKFHPSMQEFFCNDPSLDPVFEYLQEMGKPILFHTGASVPDHPDKFSQPMLLDEVAVKFPGLKIILAHSGRPFYQEAALLLRKHPNVYVDLCANKGRTGGTALLEIALTFNKIYADGMKKTLFASDFPVFSPAETLRDVIAIQNNPRFGELYLPGITQEELRDVLGKNAQELLKLDA
jgi:predicted TIM-barrel fold metal-dependent hydrolase